MKKISIVVILCIVSELLIGFSVHAYAQTSDAVPISDRNIAVFTISNVTVVEKDTYKTVSMNIDIKIQNLGSNYDFALNKRSITLTNENGLVYYGGNDCQGNGGFVMIYGDQGGEHSFPTCYNVDKESNNFKMMFNSILLDRPSYITTINLNQNQNQNSISNAGSYAKNFVKSTGSYAQNIMNSTSSYAQNVVNNTSSYVKNVSTSQSSDFFSQFVKWLKSLFHFS